MQPPPIYTPMFLQDGSTLSTPWATWFGLVANLSSTQQNDLGLFNVKSYGATGRGLLDDTTAFEKAVTDAEIDGGTLFLPSGAYSIKDEVLLNYSAANKGVSILGAGASNTRLIWDGADSTGGTPGAASASLLHIVSNGSLYNDNGSFKGFTIVSRAGHTDRFVNGMKIEDRAYLSFDDLYIAGMDNNLALKGVISSTFKRLTLADGNYNASTADSVNSSCNANTFLGCINADGMYGGWNLHNGDCSIIGGTLENNGLLGGSGAYGLKLLNDSDGVGGGNIPLNFSDVYVEGNGNGSVGKSDIWLDFTNPQFMRFNIQRNKFRRLAAAYCKNMVLLEHNSGNVVGLDVSFNSFRSFGGYTPDAARKYIDITGAGGDSRDLSFIGNDYQDAVEVPDLGGIVGTAYQPSYFSLLGAKNTQFPYHGAKVYRTTNQSIANSTDTALSWDTADRDTDSFWDVGDPTKLTVPTGVTKVRVAAGVVFAAGAGSLRLAKIFKSGAAFTGQPQQELAATSGGDTVRANLSSGVLDVAAGDYFEVIVTQNTGGALNVVATSTNGTWFEMEVVRGVIS